MQGPLRTAEHLDPFDIEQIRLSAADEIERPGVQRDSVKKSGRGGCAHVGIESADRKLAEA